MDVVVVVVVVTAVVLGVPSSAGTAWALLTAPPPASTINAPTRVSAAVTTAARVGTATTFAEVERRLDIIGSDDS
jgi:hypothetical protein